MGGLRRGLKVFGRGEIISRRVALYLSRRFSGLPLGEIGGFFGGRIPSAVSQNTRREEESWLTEDKKLAIEVDRLIRS